MSWVVCILGGASGCEFTEKATSFLESLKRDWAAFQVVISGSQNPGGSPSGTPSARDIEQGMKNAAERSKAHSEFLQEMYRVVLLREPESRIEFGNLVDTLNQGASIEGIYNGLIHSSSYRELESQNQGASPQTIRAFVEEMILLQQVLPEEERTLLTEESARPLPDLTPPEYVESQVGGGNSAAPPTPMVQGSPRALTKVEIQAWKSSLERLFIGSSIFTLKRLLGDEVLKVIAHQRSYPELLARWYGGFALRSLDRKVDFGLEKRNSTDEQFHRSWAMTAPYDVIQWEALNRVHRILNETNERLPGK